ncbi:MAG: hypothetical protein V2A71_07930 [Candidatus Eisenbacteria bacterium]
MKVFVVVVLLVSFLAVPIGTLFAEPFCDWALYSGNVIDWMVCAFFAWVIRAGEYDPWGNATVIH